MYLPAKARCPLQGSAPSAPPACEMAQQPEPSPQHRRTWHRWLSPQEGRGLHIYSHAPTHNTRTHTHTHTLSHSCNQEHSSGAALVSLCGHCQQQAWGSEYQLYFPPWAQITTIPSFGIVFIVLLIFNYTSYTEIYLFFFFYKIKNISDKATI